AEVRFDSSDGEIHFRQFPSGWVRLLAVDRNVSDTASMLANEFVALDEHAARTAARVVYTALVRLDHFHKQLDDAPRRVEFAALLAFGAGKLAKEVFVRATENVFRAVLLIAKPDVRDE